MSRPGTAGLWPASGQDARGPSRGPTVGYLDLIPKNPMQNIPYQECRISIVMALLLLVLVAISVSAQSAPHFVEVTRAAGIDFRYVNGASGRKYVPEAIGSGAAFFDADGDGLLDLYIVNGTACRAMTVRPAPMPTTATRATAPLRMLRRRCRLATRGTAWGLRSAMWITMVILICT